MSATAYTRRVIVDALALVAVVAAGLALGALLRTVGTHDLTPAPTAQVFQLGTAQPAQRPAAAVAPVARVSVPTDAPEGTYTADEAFLADLLGPDTDVTAEQALALTEVGKRYCAQVGHPESRPVGAEQATRDGYLAGMTLPGDPHAMTLDEASKLLDVATAVYCPELTR